ncbi:DUF3801 domain-containing protein, partial [Dysosmobacter welbionis]
HVLGRIVKLGHGGQRLAAVDELPVHLVADKEQAVLFGDVRHQAHLLRGEDHAGGVAGVGHQDGPCVLVDQGLDSRPVGVAVALLRSCGDRPDHAAGDTDKGVVIGIEGLRDQDLVSLVQNAGQGHLQRLAAAGSGVDVRLLQVDAQVGVVALHRRQKLRHAGGRRIGQHWVLEILHRVKEGLGRLNVRLADIQMIDLAALGLCRQLIGQKLPHGRE